MISTLNRVNSLAYSPSGVAQPQLKLLQTDHCTLCELAMDVLFTMPEVAGMGLSAVDIVSNDELLTEYGARIPVLCLGDECLDWPFSAADVVAFVARQKVR